MPARIPIALRIQALTLLTAGIHVDAIAASLGLQRRSIYRIRERATERGYDPSKDPRILMEYIEDDVRPGRPKKVTQDTEAETISSETENRSGREKSAENTEEERGDIE